jgi:hypothetical protein
VDYSLRFFIGGLAVSFFALLSDVLRPKSFAGLFGAAPSVALGTLDLHFIDMVVTTCGDYAAHCPHRFVDWLIDQRDALLGTFLPSLRAFDRPIAMACWRLFTLPPLPPRPLFAVPFL